ncbi:MAG TPA: nucleotide disphospho-sugar-binding domain-containing protein [Acidobacteriota bacterium]|nr:nucleotide disphospho-sugar-binding domain-containing protein [Acidobacteriota bacterium]
MRDHLMFGPAKALALDVLDALEQESADAMAVDFLMPGGLVAAEAAGVPAAAVVHTIYSLPAPGLAPVGMGLAAPQSALGRRGADLLNAIVAMLFNRRLKSFNQTRRELGLGPLTDSMQLYERAHRILVLTYRSFDFPASSYPANVRYVGPCLKPLPENDTGPCVDSYPVVASFSTNFADNARLVDRIHEVLSLLPHRCLLLTPAIDPDSIAEAANVDKSRFVPHEKVFPAAKVVITHGGHGTVIKALLHGLPVVCLPCDHDQSDIAQRLVSLEAGIRLSPRSTKRAIRNAVEKVLREEKFTQAARRAGDRFRLEEHPLAVEEIESL